MAEFFEIRHISTAIICTNKVVDSVVGFDILTLTTVKFKTIQENSLCTLLYMVSTPFIT